METPEIQAADFLELGGFGCGVISALGKRGVTPEAITQALVYGAAETSEVAQPAPPETTKATPHKRVPAPPQETQSNAAPSPEPEPDDDEPEDEVQTSDVTARDAVQDYFKDIGKTSLLTAEQEVDLAKRIEAGRYAELILAAREARDAGELDEFYEERVARLTEQAFRGKKTKEKKLTEAPEERIGKLITAAQKPQDPDELELIAEDGRRAHQRFVESNLRLVVSIARKYLGKDLDMADLIQEGNDGLLRAIDKFDYTLGNKFSTYATWWIRQSIQRGLADKGRTVRLPVHVVEQIGRLRTAERELIKELGHQPTVADIAQEMEVSIKSVRELLDYARRPLSLNARLGDKANAEEFGNLLIDSDAPEVFDTVIAQNFSQSLFTSLKESLTDFEYRFLIFRFGLGDDHHAHSLRDMETEFGLDHNGAARLQVKIISKLLHPASEFRAALESDTPMFPEALFEQRNCRDEPVAPFLADVAEAQHLAKRACRGCVMIDECFQDGASRNAPYGVRGGRTERERRQIAKLLAKSQSAPTPAD